MIWSIVLAALMITDVTAYDGDTLRSRGITYRLAMVDTPEISRLNPPKCWAEYAMGLLARGRVRRLLSSAAHVEAIPDHDNPGRAETDRAGWPLDRYGRRLAYIEIDGRDLGEMLIAEHLAVRWDPELAHDWCAMPPPQPQ